MSPRHFDRFILPYIQQKAQLAHELGGLHIKHSDGNLWSTLDKLVDAGIDGVNPLEPIAGMDIGQVKARYGKKLTLMGNIDVSYLLPFATPEEVERTVQETIARAGMGGGFILCDSNAVHEAVNPANYRRMIEAGQRWGRYPLDPGMAKERGQDSTG